MSESNALAERRAKRFWVSLVIVLLGIQLAIGGVAIHLAISDPSAAVIPNYHDAALNWDDAQRARLASSRLGWTVQISASDIVDTRGMRAVEITIQDELGRGIDMLRISGRVYHHARAADVKNIELPSVGDGRYLTMAAMPQGGLWQIDVAIEGASERMTEATTLEIPARGN